MTNAGGRDNVMRWKPKGYEDYLLVSELAKVCERSRDRILQAERLGQIPSPVRFTMGEIKYRLYSPAEVLTCQEYFRNARPGKPPKEAT
jgi:hypothetical protein